MIGPDKDGSLLKCKKMAKNLSIEKHIRFTGILSKKEDEIIL